MHDRIGGQHRVSRTVPPISERVPAMPPQGDRSPIELDRRMGLAPWERTGGSAAPATRQAAWAVTGIGAALACIAIVRCVMRPRN